MQCDLDVPSDQVLPPDCCSSGALKRQAVWPQCAPHLLQVQAVGIDVVLPWEASQLLAVLEQLAQIGRVPESVLDAHLPIFLRHTRLFTSAAA